MEQLGDKKNAVSCLFAKTIYSCKMERRICCQCANIWSVQIRRTIIQDSINVDNDMKHACVYSKSKRASYPVSSAYTHAQTHTHKAVQSWQAQQDRALFLFIIYSPTQHTVAGTSYRANIYSQHSSISPTKLFSSSARPFSLRNSASHIGSMSQFWPLAYCDPVK